MEYARQFLKTYDVRYIIVGQLEHAAYTPEGIAKFEQYNGKYWQAVYRDGNTVIYEVMQSSFTAVSQACLTMGSLRSIYDLSHYIA